MKEKNSRKFWIDHEFPNRDFNQHLASLALIFIGFALGVSISAVLA